MIPITFTNIDDKDFVGKWNRREYTIPAGKTLRLPDELARHFAKHLVNKVLHKAGKQITHTGDEDIEGKEVLLKKINPNLKFHKRYHEVEIDFKALKIKDAPGNDPRIALLNAESERNVEISSEVPIVDAQPDHVPEAPTEPGSPDPASEDYEPEPDFATAEPAKEEEVPEEPKAPEQPEAPETTEPTADVDPDADEDSEPSDSDFGDDKQ